MSMKGNQETGSTEVSTPRLCLRMLNGPLSGKVWRIEHQPTLIGRNVGCHVRIDDPHMSRVQCELSLYENGLHLRNMGQRNPTKVNGVVREETVLEAGDVLELTAFRLIVDTASSAAMASTVAREATRTTQSFAEAAHLSGNETGTADQADITQDLRELFNLSRTLARAETLETLASQLKAHLCARLQLDDAWLAWRVPGDLQLALYPVLPEEETRRAPFDAMHDACVSGLGVDVPEAESGDRILAAPLRHGGDPFGAIAAGRNAAKAPFQLHELHYLMAVAECAAPLIRAVERLEQVRRDAAAWYVRQPPQEGLVCASAYAQRLFAEIRQAAVSRLNVLVLGETGVGKEIVARQLHNLSGRATGPYVALNCAAIPSELFVSELFGHVRGAFTGAVRRRQGLFEQAQGGTLFLDEIGDLSLADQARMLRSVETGIIRPVGGERDLQVDVRVICATNKELNSTSQPQFRMDLYHRIAGIVIRVEPLRHRKEDIPELVTYFLHLNAPYTLAHPKGFTKDAMETLLAYPWPGNIRELRNVVERACHVARGDYITTRDLQIELASREYARPLDVSLAEVERLHLQETLRQHGWRVQEAAKALGISRSALYYKVNRLGIDLRARC